MAAPSRPRKLISIVGPLLLAGAAAVVWLMRGGEITLSPPVTPAGTSSSAPTSPATETDAGAVAIAEAFASRRSDVIVESAGRVERVLPDDDDGSRHQRFILRLSTGDTVLIAHNIDLSSRVPIEPNDRVEFRGEYEWNDRGGVVHWTHRDPAGRRAGGWLRHDGRVHE